ncbi:MULTISPECIES: hypothetical protein [Thermomonosporaceae]|uniref:hypothetical protein n=1 Tax=Thermomonosporaceae TaxID=2012 RepID=UPI00255B0A9B|nr:MULTISPECIES: hypothetical protein [Thermomonosporaceae]MDL4770854.1 hypothetical protein [Actinomadura xylanilytica]
MGTLTISDQRGASPARETMGLPDVPTRLTLRELITLRVREEVARFNAGRTADVSPLVEPPAAERALRRGLPRTGPVAWEPHAEAACRAFTRNGFFVLVGGCQLDGLDDEIDLAGDPDVVFIKLVQLVGG